MAEFDHQNENPNHSEGDSRLNDKETKGIVPEYNFWAEQMSSGAYSNYSPETNSWVHGNNVTQYVGQGSENNKKKGAEKKTLKLILKAVCFGLIAAISFIGFQQIYYQIKGEPMQEEYKISAKINYKIEATQPGVVQVKLRSVISDVVNDTMPAIVSIRSISTGANTWFGFNQPREGSGSGIVVGKNEEELLIATNNHVVAGTEQIKVTFIDGKEADAVIKGTDTVADLAVIAINISELEEETLNAIEIAKLGNSDQVAVGEMSIAIGNALGYGQSVTVGYISAKDRTVVVSDGYESKTMVLLQTDAAINFGNSGGALLNVNGEVIGINTVKYASDRVEGMGYAIPISRATPIINELMNREVLKQDEQGYLGITGRDVTEDAANSLNMPIGVFIHEVRENSAADKAGLLQGDIITGVNDIEITSIIQLKEYLTSLRIGTEVKVTYMRSMDGSYKENVVTVTLGINPDLIVSQ